MAVRPLKGPGLYNNEGMLILEIHFNLLDGLGISNLQDAVAAFKDFSAEDAAGGGPEPKREEAPKAESQEAPKAKSQGGEQKPAAKEQAQPPQQAPKPSTGTSHAPIL